MREWLREHRGDIGVGFLVVVLSAGIVASLLPDDPPPTVEVLYPTDPRLDDALRAIGRYELEMQRVTEVLESYNKLLDAYAGRIRELVRGEP